MKTSGVKITADEYFERQQDAEKTCRKKIKTLIIQALVFVALAMLTLVFFSILPNFFLVWHLIIVICIVMAIGSLLMISKAIRYYKYSLERIVEYMLTGGIVIEIPKEDYEKFDIFKSKKEKYKAKSISQMKKEEMKNELEKQKELEKKEYEKSIEEQFKKQYFSDTDEQDK